MCNETAAKKSLKFNVFIVNSLTSFGYVISKTKPSHKHKNKEKTEIKFAYRNNLKAEQK